MDADFLAELTEACEPIFVRQVEWTTVDDKPTKAKRQFSKSFLEWWSHYPKKASRDAANTAYIRAGKRIKVERNVDSADAAAILLEAVIAYAASYKGKGEFCGNPATWLNAGGWADDRATWNRPDVEKPKKQPAKLNFGDLDE